SGADARHDALRGDADHHPAAGDAGGAATARQFRHRAPQGHRTRFRGRRAGADVPGPQPRRSHLPEHADLSRRGGNLSRDEPAARLPDAPPRGARRKRRAMTWGILGDSMPELLLAAVGTLKMTALAFILAATLGLVIALLRLSRGWLSRIAFLYVEILRGMPALTLLFLVYFGLVPLGIVLQAFPAAVVA